MKEQRIYNMMNTAAFTALLEGDKKAIIVPMNHNLQKGDIIYIALSIYALEDEKDYEKYKTPFKVTWTEHIPDSIDNTKDMCCVSVKEYKE